MTLEELARLSKLLYWLIFENPALTLKDLPVLEDSMKVISALDAELSSLKQKHAETETRLSTLELGLRKLIEKETTTERLAVWLMNHKQS